MIINPLQKFANDLLAARLEPYGFVRKGMAWYKIVPDVILCVQVRKLRYHGFDMTFGIVPFVCFKAFELNLGCFQSESSYWREHPEDRARFNDAMSAISWSTDSVTYNLHDERKYGVLLEYWGDVLEKTVAPFLFKVHDLPSAFEAIGDYLEFHGIYDDKLGRIVHKRHYWPYHVSLFLKLGKYEEAMAFVEQSDYDIAYIEKLANDALEAKRYDSQFLLYTLVKKGDSAGIKAALEHAENEALSWIRKNKLQLQSDS